MPNGYLAFPSHPEILFQKDDVVGERLMYCSCLSAKVVKIDWNRTVKKRTWGLKKSGLPRAEFAIFISKEKGSTVENKPTVCLPRSSNPIVGSKKTMSITLFFRPMAFSLLLPLFLYPFAHSPLMSCCQRLPSLPLTPTLILHSSFVVLDDIIP